MTNLLLLLLLVHLASSFGVLPRYDECHFGKKIPPSELKQLKPCFNKVCLCNDTFALCVEHHSNLTYIPKLKENIIMLNFSFNDLKHITHSTFKNVSMIKMKYMWLGHNNVTHITINAFDDFKNLMFLDLRRNPIATEDLKPALQGLRNTRLQCLAISKTKLRQIDHDMFEGVPNVHGLAVTYNVFETFDFLPFQGLKYLKYLDLSYNNIRTIKYHVVSGLKQLQFNSNKFRFFPAICRETEKSSLHVLDLSHNELMTVIADDLKCLSSLTSLRLINNKFKKLDSNMFSSLINLKKLLLNHVFGDPSDSAKIARYALNNTALLSLYARDLAIDFEEAVSRYAFKGCNNLTTLSLRYNRMAAVDDDYLMELLGDMDKLEKIELDHCELKFFPSVIPNRLLNIREIHLYSNQIKSLNKGSFDRLKKLDMIILAQNGIHAVDNSVFPAALQNQLVYINMCNNSFTCNCDILWFIKWMKKDFKKFGGYPNDYRCYDSDYPKSALLINAPLSDQSCTLSSGTLPFIISIVVCTVIVLVVISSMYKWRWHIRYYIHMLRYKRRNQFQNGEEHFLTYDAFVLFCDDDFWFVRDYLMPKLEDDEGMRFCVHQRDFTPGKYIINNIVDSIANSRKVILILSNKFSDSSWCEFEMSLVQKRALEQQDGYMLVILLEDLQKKNITSSIYALLKTTTYITWPEEQGDRVMFWERVKTSLGH